MLLCRLLSKVGVCDFLIDVHSTTAKTEDFIIYTKKRKKMDKLIEAIPLKRSVFMQPSIAGKRSLIENVACGVSIEFSRKTSSKQASEVVKSSWLC